MQNEPVIFEETQFMGHNRLSIIWRTILALFCFFGYYWSENPKPVQVAVIRIGSYPAQNLPNAGKIFFFLGMFILVLSAALTYVRHIQTRVYKGYVIIDGFWTARRVKIDLSHITHARKSRYKKNIFRRAVYNLHSKGIIRFYTSGEEFVDLKDDTGFVYRIGSQKATELFNILKQQIQKS